jgi:hypothetical protein
LVARVQGWGNGGPGGWKYHVEAGGGDIRELDWKNSARLATAGPLPANTASADGQCLTANVNGALPAIDGVAPALNDRVVVKNEAVGVDPKHGLYFVSDLGSAGTPWVLCRTADANTDAEFGTGLTVEVEEGTANGGTFWYIPTPEPISVGVTPVEFTELPVTPLAATPPVDVDTTPAAVGVLGTAARADHKHGIATAAPVTVAGGTNSEGASVSLARADHLHRLGVRVQDTGGAVIGERPAVQFLGSVLVTDDPGPDRVNVRVRSNQAFPFSTAGLALVAAADVHFGFNRAGITGSIDVLATLGLGSQFLAHKPGRFLGAVLRQTDPVAGAAITVDVFVEVSVGGGAFVKTVVSAGLVIASGVCVAAVFAPVVGFAACDRLRAGVTLVAPALITVDLQATLEVEFDP